MFVTCLILLFASPVVSLAIKGILVIVMEGPLSEVRALTIPDFLGCEELKPCDIDLCDFMNDIDWDADTATMVSIADQFDPCQEASDEKFVGIELNGSAQHLKKRPATP